MRCSRTTIRYIAAAADARHPLIAAQQAEMDRSCGEQTGALRADPPPLARILGRGYACTPPRGARHKAGQKIRLRNTAENAAEDLTRKGVRRGTSLGLHPGFCSVNTEMSQPALWLPSSRPFGIRKRCPARFPPRFCLPNLLRHAYPEVIISLPRRALLTSVSQPRLVTDDLSLCFRDTGHDASRTVCVLPVALLQRGLFAETSWKIQCSGR